MENTKKFCFLFWGELYLISFSNILSTVTLLCIVRLLFFPVLYLGDTPTIRFVLIYFSRRHLHSQSSNALISSSNANYYHLLLKRFKKAFSSSNCLRFTRICLWLACDFDLLKVSLLRHRFRHIRIWSVWCVCVYIIQVSRIRRECSHIS